MGVPPVITGWGYPLPIRTGWGTPLHWDWMGVPPPLPPLPPPPIMRQSSRASTCIAEGRYASCVHAGGLSCFVEISLIVFIKGNASLSHHRSSISTNKFNFTAKGYLSLNCNFSKEALLFQHEAVYQIYKEFTFRVNSLGLLQGQMPWKTSFTLIICYIGVQILKGKKQDVGTQLLVKLGRSQFVLHYLAAFTLF